MKTLNYRHLYSTVAVLALVACGGKHKFAGSAVAVVPAADKAADAARAHGVLKEQIRVQTDVSFSLKDFGEVAPQKDADAGPAPFHLAYDGASLQLSGKADLQDLEKPIAQGKMGLSESGAFRNVSYELHVLQPEIKAEACVGKQPVIGAVQPAELWHWSGWTSTVSRELGGKTNYSITYSAPSAGDLDRDGKTKIVTTISTTNYSQHIYDPDLDPTATGYDAKNDPDCVRLKRFPCKTVNPLYNQNSAVNGPIVVLEGKTGVPVWNSFEDANVNLGMAASSTPGLADLDGDGYAEIIFATALEPASPTTVAPPRFEINAIDYHTRRLKWKFSDAQFNCWKSCMIGVADLDGDGKPEIVAGNVILDNTGKRKSWLTPAPRSLNFPPTLAEVDPASPGLEIVASSGQVYSSAGVMLFDLLSSGFYAVADLERDGSAEIINSGLGKVKVFSNKGVLKWTKDIPTAPGYEVNAGVKGGGAPNVGDFDGDGKLDIGVAGGNYYVVYTADGKELWKQTTQDNSSLSTGSTVFDFNGDGKVEVLYNDEVKMRIYDGATGKVLWEVDNPSGTLWEYPIVVNIDDDSAAEIVLSSPISGGLRAFKDPTRLWASSRRVWNQYSYYPEIVTDDLKAAVVTATPKFGFRLNAQGTASKSDDVLLPNLAVIAPLFGNDGSTGDELTLSFFVANHGNASASKGFTLNVYSKDRAKLLGTAKRDAELGVTTGALVSVKSTGPVSELKGYVVEVLRSDKAELKCANERPETKFDLVGFSRQ